MPQQKNRSQRRSFFNTVLEVRKKSCVRETFECFRVIAACRCRKYKCTICFVWKCDRNVCRNIWCQVFKRCSCPENIPNSRWRKVGMRHLLSSKQLIFIQVRCMPKPKTRQAVLLFIGLRLSKAHLSASCC